MKTKLLRIFSLLSWFLILVAASDTLILAKEEISEITLEPVTLTKEISGPINNVVITLDPSQCQPNPCTVLTLPAGYEGTAVAEETDMTDPIKVYPDTILETSKAEALLKNTYGEESKIKISPPQAEGCRQEDQLIICKAEAKLEYTAQISQQRKVLGIIPITVKQSVTMDARSGDVVSEDIAWYTKILKLLSN